MFPFILADLPCTGSGTWSRTPEAMYFFDPQTISNFRQRQEKILSNINSRLKPGGTLVYITCSVFAAENEGVVSYVTEPGKLRVEQEQMISGYTESADSMFVSRMGKS